MRTLQDQHVLILGLGVSGLAMARWCAGRGARVTVADTRTAPPQLAALQRDLPDARFVSGALDAALRQGADVCAVFKSPGLTPKDVAAVAALARTRGLALCGELGLFSKALAELRTERDYRPSVLAITGTNGKTTVTSLTAQLVQRAGKTVAMAGNIGPTLLDTLSQRLADATLPEVWVLELSSFQLDGETGFEPSAATVLNITQDHLDWHENMAAYARAKANIFGQRGLLVLNREDRQVMALLTPQLKPKRAATTYRPHLTFGADSPTRAGDFGLEPAGGLLWLVRAEGVGAPPRKAAPTAAEQELYLQRLMPVDALRIRGRHNAVNALAALALASSVDCAMGPMLYGLREYRGEPHRVQSIGVLGEVEFFDDSKGTNVGATVAALCGLGAERRVVVIMGGQGKGQDFSPLAPAVARYARAVVLIGRDAPLLRAALQACGVALIDVASLEQAVTQAAALAQPGDAVLMSPACASYDMFEDYQHRARVFVAAVQAQARLAGVRLEEQP